MSHEKIAATFDEWATNGRGERMQDGHGDVVAQVIEKLNVRAGFQVLDLGCGIGWATRILAQLSPGVQAIGIDAAPAMVKKAEGLSSLTIRARYEVGSFENLDFKDGKFDQVFSMEALYYAPDLPKAISEMARVLKSGSCADTVIDLYDDRPSTSGWSDSLGLDMHRLTEDQWIEAFQAAGFERVTCTRVIDSRGPGEESEFTANVHYPDWDSYQAYHAAGSLWIHAVKV